MGTVKHVKFAHHDNFALCTILRQIFIVQENFYTVVAFIDLSAKYIIWLAILAIGFAATFTRRQVTTCQVWSVFSRANF
jgi:hypothetical protein